MDEKTKYASLIVTGHSCYAEKGKDIVCSAATILAYTLAQNIKVANMRGLLKSEPKIKIEDGHIVINCRAKTDGAYAEVLHTYLVIQTGYQLLAHNYPKYVSVEMFGNAE